MNNARWIAAAAALAAFAVPVVLTLSWIGAAEDRLAEVEAATISDDSPPAVAVARNANEVGHANLPRDGRKSLSVFFHPRGVSGAICCLNSGQSNADFFHRARQDTLSARLAQIRRKRTQALTLKHDKFRRAKLHHIDHDTASGSNHPEEGYGHRSKRSVDVWSIVSKS